MHNSCIIYLCNALEDVTRNKRQITSDSPAASQKVFGLCNALKSVGGHVHILSLGRGRQNGSWKRHSASAKRFNGVSIAYASFWHVPFLTHIVTLISLVPLIWRLNKEFGNKRLIVYNRTAHYLFGLMVARLLGFQCFLDLEDGYATENISATARLKNFLIKKIYDYLCDQGVMLANWGLASQTKSQRLIVCYGVAEKLDIAKDWGQAKLNVMFSGTLLEEVGPRTLMEAIRNMKKVYPGQLEKLHFIVTGKGPFAGELSDFSRSEATEWVEYHGMVSRERYRELLSLCHVGMSLRLSSYEMSATTFPSKVIEYAGNGLLVISTAASDVPKVFSGGSALLLQDESPKRLAEALAWVVDHPAEAEGVARAGHDRVGTLCDPIVVGTELKCFLEGVSNNSGIPA